jgi:Sulfotransferase family
MLVFWKPKLVFLATPKTGTTAITAALESLAAVSIPRPAALKHTNVQRYHQFLHPYLETAAGGAFSVVAMIREPRDWLGSWYRFRQQDGLTDAHESTANVSFDEFVQAYCREVRPNFANVGSQAEFLAPHNDKSVDHLFRYEDINTFLHYLEEKLDCEILLPRLNVSPPGKLELTAKSEALLHSFAAKDFAIYRTLQPVA